MASKSPHETVNAEGAQCEQHFSRAAVTALLVHLCVKKECVQADYQSLPFRLRADRVSKMQAVIPPVAPLYWCTNCTLHL